MRKYFFFYLPHLTFGFYRS